MTNFRLDKGISDKEHTWEDAAGPKTRKNREEPIRINNAFNTEWVKYYNHESVKNVYFKYLAIQVKKHPPSCYIDSQSIIIKEAMAAASWSMGARMTLSPITTTATSLCHRVTHIITRYHQ